MSNSPIGYGKPPKKSQYRPGQSGNPKGRPKGAKSLKSVLQKELTSKIEIKVQGKKTKATKLEAAIMKLVNDALSGNAKALSELLKLAAVHMPQDADGVSNTLPPSEEDQALLAAYVEHAIKLQNKEAKNGK
jgi:hypothetical protein